MLNARAIQLATDAPYYPAKTPAASSKNRRENVYQGAMTVQNGKAKNVNLLRTPFQPKSAQPQRISKDLPPKAPAIQLVVANQPRPLADKTPFVNRVLNDYQTPGPVHQPLKPLNLGTTTTLEVPPDTNPTPGSARASSARKHTRLPKPQTHHDFQTPANIGNHWDISDDDIVIPEEMDETEKETEEEPLDFNDEIEYMAPNTLNLEYQPPFDFELPDYKLLGHDVLHKFYNYPEEQTTLPPPLFEFTFKDEEFMKWDDLSLPPLSPSDDDNKRSDTVTRRNSKQSQVTRMASSVGVKKPVGSTRSVSVIQAPTPVSTVTTKKPTGINRSSSVMNVLPTIKPPASACLKRPASVTNIRSQIKPPASARLHRPASVMHIRPHIKPPAPACLKRPASVNSSKPSINTTAGAARSATRTSTTTIKTASTSSLKHAITSGTSFTKTKPKQTTASLATTKATTSAKGGRHSISNIPRPSSTVNSMRPASAIGANNATRRSSNIATIKRPSTSASVTRPKAQALTTTTSSSSSTSVQRGTKSSLPTTRGFTAATASNIKVDKKPPTSSSRVKTMTKGKTLSSTDLVKKSSGVTTSQDRAGALPEKVKEKMDEDVCSRSFVGVRDVASLEHVEIKLRDDHFDRDDDGGDEDDRDEYDEDEYDDEETIRLVKKPETEDIVTNTTGQKEPTNHASSSQDSNVIVADNTIYRHGQIDVEEGGEFNLSTVEEVTEVSISVDLIERLEVLKLE